MATKTKEAVSTKRFSAPTTEKKPVVQAQDDSPKGGKIAIKDINLTYRSGSFVPDSQIKKWESMGIDWKVWF